MNEVRRIFSLLFWEPGAAFADIVRRPRWPVPIILIILGALAYTYLLSQRIGWESLVRDRVANSQQVQNMPAADRERLIEQQARYAGVVAYVGGVVGTPVSLLVIAGAITLMFSVFLGGNAKFRQVFGVTAYAQLPYLLFMALAVMVLYLKPPGDFDVQNPVGLNVGFYIPSDAAPAWLISIATSIDLVTLWVMALIVIGLRKIDIKAARGTALSAVLLPWAVWVLGKAAFAAITG